MVQDEEQKFLNKLGARYTKELRDKLEYDEEDPEFEDIIRDYEQGIIHAETFDVISAAYLSSRAVHFHHRQLKNFEAVVSEASKHVETIYDSGAYYRVPKNRGRMRWDRNDPTEAVLSLNVIQDKKLIRQLDEFTTRHKCFYATVEPKEWNETYAPVQIYFKEPLKTDTPENKEKFHKINAELAKIVSPYARNQEPGKADIPFTDKFSEGIYQEKTVRQDVLDKEMDSFKKELPGHIFNGIQDFVVEKSGKQGNKLNLVQYKAVEEFYQTYTRQYLGNIRINVRDEGLKVNQAYRATDDEKQFYRETYQRVAMEERAAYSEDRKSKVFKTKIIKSTGETVTIKANRGNVSIVAKDKKGQRVAPSLKYFEGVAKVAASKGRGINLDTLKRPEAKARAYLACLSNQPRVKTINAPLLDKNFLSLLEPETQEKLKPFMMLNRRETDLKTIVFGSNFEKVRPENETVKAVTKESNANPVETALPNGGYGYKKDLKAPSSWELAVSLKPKADSKPLSRFLKLLQVSHTVTKNSGNDAKTVTAYITSNRDVGKLGGEIQKNFSNQLEPKSFIESFIPKAWSEKLQDIKAVFIPQKSEIAGTIAPIRVPSAKSEDFLVDAGINKGILSEKTLSPIADNKDPAVRDKAFLLEAYVSHQIYSKYGKENYYGEDRLGFEKRVFGRNLLPKAGSKERTQWDLAAGQYEVFLQKNAPERLKLMGKVISREDPVDFGKAKLFAPAQDISQSGINLMGKELD